MMCYKEKKHGWRGVWVGGGWGEGGGGGGRAIKFIHKS